MKHTKILHFFLIAIFLLIASCLNDEKVIVNIESESYSSSFECSKKWADHYGNWIKHTEQLSRYNDSLNYFSFPGKSFALMKKYGNDSVRIDFTNYIETNSELGPFYFHFHQTFEFNDYIYNKICEEFGDTAELIDLKINY